MKPGRVSMLLSLLLLLAPVSMMGYPPPEALEPSQRMPYIDPTTAPEGCSVPNGYSAACGYYASTAGGDCSCREGGPDTTLCMKSNAGTGCGIFESPNDECCSDSGGF